MIKIVGIEFCFSYNRYKVTHIWKSLWRHQTLSYAFGGVNNNMMKLFIVYKTLFSSSSQWLYVIGTILILKMRKLVSNRWNDLPKEYSWSLLELSLDPMSSALAVRLCSTSPLLPPSCCSWSPFVCLFIYLFIYLTYCKYMDILKGKSKVCMHSYEICH